MCALIKSSYYTSASITVSSKTCRASLAIMCNDDSPKGPAIQNPVATRALRKVNATHRALLRLSICQLYVFHEIRCGPSRSTICRYTSFVPEVKTIQVGCLVSVEFSRRQTPPTPSNNHPRLLRGYANSSFSKNRMRSHQNCYGDWHQCLCMLHDSRWHSCVKSSA
jgi:hypothetical protein